MGRITGGELFPVAEYAYNSHVHLSMLFMPFWVINNYYSAMQFKLPKVSSFWLQKQLDMWMAVMEETYQVLQQQVL